MSRKAILALVLAVTSILPNDFVDPSFSFSPELYKPLAGMQMEEPEQVRKRPDGVMA